MSHVLSDITKRLSVITLVACAHRIHSETPLEQDLEGTVCHAKARQLLLMAALHAPARQELSARPVNVSYALRASTRRVQVAMVAQSARLRRIRTMGILNATHAPQIRILKVEATHPQLVCAMWGTLAGLGGLAKRVITENSKV